MTSGVWAYPGRTHGCKRKTEAGFKHANTHNGGFTYAIETLLAIAFLSSHVTAFKYRLTVNHPHLKPRLMSHVIICPILNTTKGSFG